MPRFACRFVDGDSAIYVDLDLDEKMRVIPSDYVGRWTYRGDDYTFTLDSTGTLTWHGEHEGEFDKLDIMTREIMLDSSFDATWDGEHVDVTLRERAPLPDR